ncbi:hypothetical protein BJ165DRAFT_1527917 [Panaeolus papilionaceus]|nr:hypothetical protein BJ165DRAFT_1527917 [Panaeolus papilionaceus]
MSLQWPRSTIGPEDIQVLPSEIELAAQLRFVTYTLVGSCGVLFWDIVDNLRDDYKLVSEHRFRIRLPTIAYVVSRLGTLGLALTSSLYQTASITSNCAHFLKFTAPFFPIAISATSFLFFLRLKAIFHNNLIVVVIFGIMWTTVFITTFAFPTGMGGVLIQLSPIVQYCTVSETHRFVIAPNIMLLVYDTLVFFAISWRLVSVMHVDKDSPKGWSVGRMVFGGYLPSFSRALLHDNQRFYAATVLLNLFNILAFFLEAIPPTCRAMFAIPNIILMNIMACRVYRNTKFGLSRDPGMEMSSIYLHSESSTGVERSRDGIGRRGAVPRSLPLRFNHERTLSGTFEVEASQSQSNGEVYRCRSQISLPEP